MFIKRPGGYRKSYSLIGNDGKTLHDPRVDAVNLDLKAGVASDLLEARMRAIILSYKPPKTPLSISNEKLVEARHTEKIRENPSLGRAHDLKIRLVTGAAWLGNTSILEASKNEIYDALKNVPAIRIFEARRAINELLKYAKRPFRLKNKRPARPDEIQFIRISEFLEKKNKLGKYEVVLGALFATGARFSELPLAQLNNESAHIGRALNREGQIKTTKNNKSRSAPVLPPLEYYVLAYRKLELDVRMELWRSQKSIWYVMRKVFGIRIHDLRHSYAVEWGAKGCSTSEIARFIGDTEAVCERYYRNYCATPDELIRARNRWK